MNQANNQIKVKKLENGENNEEPGRAIDITAAAALAASMTETFDYNEDDDRPEVSMVRRKGTISDHDVDLIVAGRVKKTTYEIPSTLPGKVSYFNSDRLKNKLPISFIEKYSHKTYSINQPKRILVPERDFIHLLGEVDGTKYDYHSRPELETWIIAISNSNYYKNIHNIEIDNNAVIENRLLTDPSNPETTSNNLHSIQHPQKKTITLLYDPRKSLLILTEKIELDLLLLTIEALEGNEVPLQIEKKIRAEREQREKARKEKELEDERLAQEAKEAAESANKEAANDILALFSTPKAKSITKKEKSNSIDKSNSESNSKQKSDADPSENENTNTKKDQKVKAKKEKQKKEKKKKPDISVMEELLIKATYWKRNNEVKLIVQDYLDSVELEKKLAASRLDNDSEDDENDEEEKEVKGDDVDNQNEADGALGTLAEEGEEDAELVEIEQKKSKSNSRPTSALPKKGDKERDRTPSRRGKISPSISASTSRPTSAAANNNINSQSGSRKTTPNKMKAAEEAKRLKELEVAEAANQERLKLQEMDRLLAESEQRAREENYYFPTSRVPSPLVPSRLHASIPTRSMSPTQPMHSLAQSIPFPASLNPAALPNSSTKEDDGNNVLFINNMQQEFPSFVHDTSTEGAPKKLVPGRRELEGIDETAVVDVSDSYKRISTPNFLVYPSAEEVEANALNGPPSAAVEALSSKVVDPNILRAYQNDLILLHAFYFIGDNNLIHAIDQIRVKQWKRFYQNYLLPFAKEYLIKKRIVPEVELPPHLQTKVEVAPTPVKLVGKKAAALQALNSGSARNLLNLQSRQRQISAQNQKAVNPTITKLEISYLELLKRRLDDINHHIEKNSHLNFDDDSVSDSSASTASIVDKKKKGRRKSVVANNSGNTNSLLKKLNSAKNLGTSTKSIGTPSNPNATAGASDGKTNQTSSPPTGGIQRRANIKPVLNT